MRLNPFRRKYAATPDAGEWRAGLDRASGNDGVSWYTNVLAGGPDTNPLLTGRNKYEIYREMAVSDPAVRSVEWMFRLPVREAAWSLDPASSDPVDQVIADFVEDNLGLGDEVGWLDQTWDESLNQALLFLRWGSMGEEIIFAPELREWTDADGDVHLLRPLARLAPRSPSTVFRFNTNAQTGLIDSIEQDLPDAKPIPGDKLCWYALDREGNNWFGTSALRPMWGAWSMKTKMMVAAGIGWDRFASGTPLILHPSGDANERRANEIGRNYRQHEQAWVALANDGWSFSIEGGAGTLADPVPLLRHYDQQIAAAGLQSFSQLGVTDTGSRAVGEVLSEPYYRAAAAIAEQIAASRTRWVVRRIVDVNFGTEIEVPTLRVSKIVPQDIVGLSLALYNLSNAGFSFSDRNTQDDLRDRLGISPLPDLDEPTADRLARVVESLPDGVGVAATNGSRVPVEGGSPGYG